MSIVIKMKKIAIFAGYYLPTIGGYTKNIHEIARRLAIRGYQVDVFTCNTEDSSCYEELDDVRIFRMPAWNILGGNYPFPKPSIITFKILYNAFRTNYGIFNIQTRFFLVCAIGWLLSVIKRSPLIYMERGSVHSVVNSSLVNILSIIYDHSMGFLITKKARINMGVSKSAVRFIKHLGAKNPIVMHNGIDMVPFQLDKELPQHDYVVITFIGRLIYAKGVQDLVLALEDVEFNYKLLVVGDGSFKVHLEDLVKEHLYGNNNVEFLGYKSGSDIPKILKKTDIFVNPSYSEGLPTSVMESCAAGCATIATDVGGTNEIIINGINGFLYKPHDINQLQEKLNLLIKNPKLRDELGKKARSYVENEFSWEDITERWVKLIETL